MSDRSEEPFEDPLKQCCWQTWWQGYLLGKDVENPHTMARRTARARFERWWRREMEEL